MNPDWKNFLLAEKATFDNETDAVFPLPAHKSNKRIYPLVHLGLLTVEGADAATFLQGQITCDVNDITETKSSLGSICNPKGRTIAVFLLIKNADAFLMVLPKELLAPVKERLQRYVLRSKVSLTDSSGQLCLTGLCDGAAQPCATPEQFFPTSRQENILVELQGRSLIISETDNAKKLWSEQIKLGFQPDGSAQWRYLDVIAGIPWLTVSTAEEFIPQMLNLDKLGAISFKKGCYTGQEIVARTHYLGKAKRAMFLAESSTLAPPQPNSTIIDSTSGMELGKVLYGQNDTNSCKMLIVLQISDDNTYNLKLENGNQEEIILIGLPETCPAKNL